MVSLARETLKLPILDSPSHAGLHNVSVEVKGIVSDSKFPLTHTCPLINCSLLLYICIINAKLIISKRSFQILTTGGQLDWPSDRK